MTIEQLLFIAGVLLLLAASPRIYRWFWWRFARIAVRRRRPARFVCPVCVRNLNIERDFCFRCGTPLTGFAASGPIPQIATTGEMYRRAVSRPSTTAVVGLWLLTGPALGMLIGEIIYYE